MKKQIKRWGGSLIIKLSSEELDYYNLGEGDWVEINQFVKIQKIKEVKENE